MENDDFDRESEDALSFRDLPTTSDNEQNAVVSPHADPPRASNFEFATVYAEPPETGTLAFSGEPDSPARSQSEFIRHPRNGLFIRRDSFKRFHSFRASGSDDVATGAAVNRSSSVRFGCNSKVVCSPSTPGRHKAVIGVVKIQSKMEMSDIRKRQSRRLRAAPATMFSAGSGRSGEAALAISGQHEEGVVVEKSGGHHWGLFKPLRSSAHLVGSLTKFGCIPHHV